MLNQALTIEIPTEEPQEPRVSDAHIKTLEEMFSVPNENLKLDATDFKFSREKYIDTVLEIALEIIKQRKDLKEDLFAPKIENIRDFVEEVNGNKITWGSKSDWEEVRQIRAHVEAIHKAHFLAATSDETEAVEIPAYKLPGLKNVFLHVKFQRDEEGKNPNSKKIKTEIHISTNEN